MLSDNGRGTRNGAEPAVALLARRMNILLAVLVAVASVVAWQGFQFVTLSQKLDRCATATSGATANALDDSTRATDQLEAAVSDLTREVTRLSQKLDRHLTDSHRVAKTVGDVAKEAVSEPVKTKHDVNAENGLRTINFIYGLWDDKPMQPEFRSNLEAWRKLNPAWTVKVWSNAEIREFWRTEFPEYKSLWRKARPIQRADLARYMLVYKFGGLYADLDCSPSQPIDEIFHSGGVRYVQHDTVLCVEDEKSEQEMESSAQWAIRAGVPEFKTRVANYVFWARPGSATIKRTLDLAVERLRTVPENMYWAGGKRESNLKNAYAIIYTTGPDVLTEATFSDSDSNGQRAIPANVRLLPTEKCHLNNLATGTWIGDGNVATDPPKSQRSSS